MTFSASPFFILQKNVYFWPVIYWSDIKIIFYIFILSLGRLHNAADFNNYDGITVPKASVFYLK